MFRSLLLLSVLATLFVIAFKGPDQTALQYAAEIGVRASELFPRAETIPAIATRPGEPRSPTEPQPAVLEAWDDLDRRMRETFGTDEAEPVRPATIPVAPVVAGGRQLHATGPAPIAVGPVAAEPTPALQVVEVLELAARPSVAAAPEVPTNLRELERYYENASRLLAEIE